MKICKILILITFLFLGACTHALHQYHVSDSEPYLRTAKVKKVEAMSQQFTVMGIIDNTKYVNEAYEDLERQCPNGKVTGIHTRFSTSHGFFSWTNKVKMTGYCVN